MFYTDLHRNGNAHVLRSGDRAQHSGWYVPKGSLEHQDILRWLLQKVRRSSERKSGRNHIWWHGTWVSYDDICSNNVSLLYICAVSTEVPRTSSLATVLWTHGVAVEFCAQTTIVWRSLSFRRVLTILICDPATRLILRPWSLLVWWSSTQWSNGSASTMSPWTRSTIDSNSRTTSLLEVCLNIEYSISSYLSLIRYNLLTKQRYCSIIFSYFINIY